MCYERKEKYSLKEIFDHVYTKKEFKANPKLQTREFDGDLIRMTSQRYQVFKFNGHVCVDCGIEGTFFAKERHKSQNTKKYHFNLYGFDANGNEVMMTKDHVKPRAEGGSEGLFNLVCRCRVCNEKKGSKWDGFSGC